MLGLLSALAVTAGLSSHPAPAAHSAAHDATVADKAYVVGTMLANLQKAAANLAASAAASAGGGAPAASAGGGAPAAGAGPVAPVAAPASAPPWAANATPGLAAGGAPAGPSPSGFGATAPLLGTLPAASDAPSPPAPDTPVPGAPAPGAPTPTPPPQSGPGAPVSSGAGGPGAAIPTTGATGECDINVTNLMTPLMVECHTGSSGDASGTATGGNSGNVNAVGPLGRHLESSGSTTSAADLPGGSSASASEGAKGACRLSSTNASAAALSVDCTTGAVGAAGASASGGSPGPRTAGGASGGGPADVASGAGGDATTRATSGSTGNCVIRLTNIAAALTVVCVSGHSGSASGTSHGGQSGSAVLLTPGPGGVAASGTAGVAASGSGGNAVAVISTGSTGTCTIFLVNVRAQVSVLCITGDSGDASGTAAGGESGAALLMSAPAPAGSGGGHGSSGAGGHSTALVTSGGTGDCAISLTNALGSISFLCRTGNSGSALGKAVAGDSGPALVMLKAPSQLAAATPASPASPFATVQAANHARSVWSPLSGRSAVPAALPAVAIGQTAFLPVTGLGTTVPMSLAAGLLLSGAATVAATGRRRRRLVRS